MSTSPIDYVLSRLSGVKKAGGGWLTLCPEHDDHHPSLSVGVDERGVVYLHCFAGCETADVLRAAGMTWPDLFPPDHRHD